MVFPSPMFAKGDAPPPPTSPFASWALALPFAAGGPCVVDALTYASLGAVPGYVFSDNGDNLPTIDGGGYHSLIAEASRMKIAAPTIGDEDFILWAVADLAAAGGGMIAALTNAVDDYAHMFQLYRSGSDLGGYARVGGSDVYLSNVATVDSDPLPRLVHPVVPLSNVPLLTSSGP